MSITKNSFGKSTYDCNGIVDAGTVPLVQISDNRRSDGWALTARTR
jgi:hypothetical protein